MTKTSMHRNLLREHLDLYKHAIIWETQLTKFTDDSQQLERKGLDEFRREIHDNSQIPEKDSKHVHHSSDPNDAEPTIEDAEKVAMVWDHFSRQTTFHGVKYIESKDRRRFSRMFWLFLVLGMAGGLIYTVANLMIEFYEYNTVTKSDIKVAGSTIFPSITLCNNCPYKNGDGSTTSPVFQLMATTANLAGLNNINYSDPAMLEFLSMSSISAQNKYSYTQDDLFFSVKYENVYVNVTEAFEITKTTYGRCFTFNGPKYIAKHGPRLVTGDGRNSGLRLYVNLHQDKYFIYDDITAGIRMYISQHPETPRLERDGIDIHPGTSARLALTPVQYTFLPFPYKSYGTETCEEVDPVEMSYKMVNSTYYSYDNCLEQCLNYRAALNCSCYSHFLYVPDLAECNMSQMYTCFLRAREEISSENCDCPRPCTFTRHEITMSASQLPSKVSAKYLQKLLNASSIPELRYLSLIPTGDQLGEQYLELRVYLDTMMLRHEKHVPQYTFNSIFAFLGGQMGFFMGASLITLAELLETLLFSLFIFVRKKVMRMGQLDTTSTASSSNSAISTISNPIGAKREAWK